MPKQDIPIESRTSNALGVRLPIWIIKQLDKRSEQLQVKNQSSTTANDNVIFRGNRTSWVRLVSSVDLIDPFKISVNTTAGRLVPFSYQQMGSNKAKTYFQNLGINVSNASDLAKFFVLQGGTSKYSNEENTFFYNLRQGLSDSYNVAGNSETKNYGYRPMPGITSVKVQTQGKLGSIRAAEIQLKVWDKAQLDIIDALYFKLGYTMFLEWGHTYYYKSDSGELASAEDFSIDPFESGLTKEDVYNKISNNVRNSEGNYDAMLGVVTNFNFSYNQEGGYDCTIKMISLGVLISNMKMNNPRILPELQDAVVKRLVNTLTKIEKDRIAREQAAAAAAAAAAAPPPPPPQNIPLTAEELVNQNLKFDKAANIYTGARIVYSSFANQLIRSADLEILNTAYGNIFLIRKLKGFIPLRSDLLSQVKVKLDATDFFNVVKNLETRTWESDIDVFKAIFSPTEVFNRIKSLFSDGPDSDSKKNNSYREIEVNYVSTNKLSYSAKIRAKTFAITEDAQVVDKYYPIEQKEFVDQLKSVLNNPNNEFTISNLEVTDVMAQPGSLSKDKVAITFKFTIPFTKTVSAIEKGQPDPRTLQLLPDKQIQKSVKFDVFTELTIEDTRFIKSFTTQGVIQPKDFLGAAPTETPATGPAGSGVPQAPAPPTLNAEDIQKTESQKYRSAFEVIIRTIQLYSLDRSISSGIEKDHVVKELLFLEESKTNNTLKEFTKPLFSVGLFGKMFDELISLSKAAEKQDPNLGSRCESYDSFMRTGTIPDKEEMLLIRALFGFHFGLLGNICTAKKLFDGNLAVNYDLLMRSYTVPYEFNQGIFEGSQLNHPVYIPLGFVIMILNHMCTIYDNNKPVVYLDFNHKSNLCLSNSKHLSTNPYDILIPFQGTNKDFESIIEPTTLAIKEVKDKSTGKVVSTSAVIKHMSGSKKDTPIYTPKNDSQAKDAIKDRISGGLLPFKIGDTDVEYYRGRTMNVLISCDYLLRIVKNFSTSNGSGDVYVREFIEQILSDINKSIGDINVFRLAYDDGANAAHVVDDQMTPNLEGRYPVANEDLKDVLNRSRLPLFGKGSIARNIEIRTEVSSKLSNMVAISANASIDDQSNLSKSAESFGFYNNSYRDRYVPSRTEFTSSLVLPTDTMIRSSIQFNEAIKTFYGDAKPAEGSVGHATNYYIQRMSKIKSSEKGTRAAAMIPVSLNFSIDGMSGFGMGQSFTIDPEYLPYTYNLSLTDPYGEPDVTRTVAFIMTGLDHTIEGNQWISSVRSNMIYSKDAKDFIADKIKSLDKPTGLAYTPPSSLNGGRYISTDFSGAAVAAKKLNYTADQIMQAVKKKGYTWYEQDYKLNIVGVRNSSTQNQVTNRFDDVITVTYKEGGEIKFYQWAITTDPGIYFVKNFMKGTDSTGRLVPSQYINTYNIGLHRDTYEALVQTGGKVKAFRDANKDNIYDEDVIREGSFGMNIHRASPSGVVSSIDNTSAGCQVFSSTQDFNNFMAIARYSRSKLNSNSFTYTLLLSDDIS